MLFTSDSKPMVEVTGLDIKFRLRLNAENSIRARFIELVSSPLSFGRRRSEMLHVLKSVRFRAVRGDRIAILGRNGAGKSTLCRFLAGIYRSEQVKIDSRYQVRAVLEPGLVVYPELTGRENAKLLIGLIYPELSAETAAELLDEVLAFSELGTFLDTPFRHYSNGMQARLCLSVATARASDVFILDEVFDAADKPFRERISRKVLGLIKEAGVVFFVSHTEAQARLVCNKAIVLEAGEVKFFGGIDEGYAVYNMLLEAGRGSVKDTSEQV